MIYVLVKQNKLTQEDTKLIKNILSICEVEEYTLQNLAYWKPNKIEDNDIVFIFGKNAETTFKMYNKVAYCISMPSLDKLNIKTGDTKARKDTYKTLCELKDFIKLKAYTTSEKFNPKNIRLTTEELIYIRDNLKRSYIESFVCKDDQNRLISINLSNKENKEADININIDALLAIKQAENILKLQDINIIYK